MGTMVGNDLKMSHFNDLSPSGTGRNWVGLVSTPEIS